ncbi:MAG: EAL domain-containing protein, partial [Oscillospiraceae bacterium]|nr:EAL domain-containing protein [Oscillospiraceae bacterium]
YSDEMRRRELYNEHLVNDIHKALEEEQFIVYFQPKYNIRGEKPFMASAEALIRWQHPEYGMVSPGDFIPLFEGNGLIQLVDHYVWRGAARFIRRMKDKYGVCVPISINVSRIDLHDPELDRVLEDIIRENGLDYSDLYLEVTESAYAGDSKHIIDTVSRLRNKGFRIELDDFGSGYSSLNMLTELPIDVLKMDMKFIQNVKQGKKDMRLIELVMDIAGYLKVPVVAEGVETEEQMLLLKEVRCDIIQGYYFSRPLPPDKFEEHIKEELC